jgi:His-Xaa-Ser system protein HxsD
MQEAISEIKEGKVHVRLMKEIYDKEAVLNATYKMTDKYSVLIKPVGDHEISVIIEPKGQQSVEELELAASDFCNEVLDQQIRLDLEKRFGKIRELIVEHAFSPLADLKSRLAQIK